MENRQWRLIRKPATLVSADDIELVTVAVPAPGAGEVLLEMIHLSLDPGQQFYMSSSENVGGGTMSVGDVVRGWGVGRVVASNAAAFPVGSYARDRYGFAGMQEYSVLPAASLAPVDPAIAPLPAQIGVLGMPGLTAYFGMIDIGRPQPGDTAVISAAAGAVGSAAGQLAKVKGARAVGIAGGPEKCRFVVEEFGLDACVDYKAGDLQSQLASACPDGIDVYFDNVGGEILDACLGRMRLHGRVVSCGAIAAFGDMAAAAGVKNYLSVLIQSLRWEGLSIHNYYARYDEAYAALEQWAVADRLNHREEIAVGLENFLPAFHRLFTGSNFGKLVLQVKDGRTA